MFEMWEGLEVAHAITRTVGDSAALLDLTNDPEVGDAYVAPRKLSVSRADRDAMFSDLGMFCPFTALANQTGQPAMSVPLHWTPDGLPVGVQFLGRFGDEATLFQLAAQLVKAQPWAESPVLCDVHLVGRLPPRA